MFWAPGTPEPEFTDELELDLSTIQPSMAGPKRPQDRVELKNVKAEFFKSMAAPLGNLHAPGIEQRGEPLTAIRQPFALMPEFAGLRDQDAL